MMTSFVKKLLERIRRHAKGFVGGVVATLLVASCGGAIAVRVWILDPNQGLVRTQDPAVIPFSQARGYRCVSKTDFDYLIEQYEDYKTCCEDHGGN